MLEPEMAFADLKDIMNNAENYLKFLFAYVLQNNKEDMKFFDERVKKGQIEYIKRILESDFKRVDYSDAVKILQKVYYLYFRKLKKKVLNLSKTGGKLVLEMILPVSMKDTLPRKYFSHQFFYVIFLRRLNHFI